MSGAFTKDSEWTRQSFLVRQDQIEPADFERRVFSTTRYKFTDTTPGGNICINPPPQFNTSTDIRIESPFLGSKLMGRYYSEAIDDHNQVIHMRFGVPQFNSLTTFFSGFYNSEAGTAARTGRTDGSKLYALGKAAGYIVPLIAFPLFTITAHIVTAGLRFALQKPSSKFYFLKPTMPTYWMAVQTMFNQLMVNKRIIPRVFSTEQEKILPNQGDGSLSNSGLHDLLPDIFHKNGGVDVFAVANKAQRLARKQYMRQAELLGDVSNLNIYEKMKFTLQENIVDPGADFFTYLDKWWSAANSKVVGEDNKTNTTEEAKKDEDSNAGFFDFLKAELDDGAGFASFRVNATGSIGDTFSNQVTESDLQNKMNSTSASSRSTMFNLANGNISDGMIGTAIGKIIGGVTDVVSGIADGLGASGLAMLGGAAFVDIPKHWQSSSANIGKSTYTIHLSALYGNPISQAIDMDLPLCMLLAAAMPISTGKQSYTSPFLVELYDKGRCQTRLGIIDSMTVTRGTSNLAFNTEGNAMGIDVTFSVLDLSSVMHMPISAGFSLDPTAGIFDDDTIYTDYMAVLSAMDLKDQIYVWPKFKNNLTRALAKWDTWTSPAYYASFLGSGTTLGRLMSVVYKGTAR
jgi:hypothetical protein